MDYKLQMQIFYFHNPSRGTFREDLTTKYEFCL